MTALFFITAKIVEFTDISYEVYYDLKITFKEERMYATLKCR